MNDITIIIGPTASGKSRYSIEYANSLKKENKKAIVINADASAVYKNFPILTAQNHKDSDIEHVLFEIEEITQSFSVARWLLMVEDIIRSEKFRGHHKIIVGGTCMYIFLLINGLVILPSIKEEFRLEAEKTMESLGYEEFLKKVQSLDKETYTDTQRLINNYAIIQQTGKTFKEWQKEKKKIFLQSGEYNLVKIMKTREEIYENCNKRFLNMLEEGALDEVKTAMALYGNVVEFKKIIGASELRDYVEGKINLEFAIKLGSQKTRNLAKSQMTWINNKF